MKKFLLLILFISFLYSCESEVAEETKQIWDNYIKTLDKAPDDAQKAVDLINQRQEEIIK